MQRFITAALTALSFFAAAHTSAHSSTCAKRKAAYGLAAKGTIASPLENDYDVKTVKLDLAMSNLATDIFGTAITNAEVTKPAGLSQYAFELDTVLTIDSMKINGTAYTPVASAGFLRIVTLTNPLPPAAQFSAQVWYHGTPPSGTGFFTHGVNHNTLASGTQITYTLSDPYLAKDWWPCKQSLQDKIDQATIWITVPQNLKAGCNGKLLQVTPVPGGNRYEWKTTYPIDYYLIAASVAPYSDYSRWMHFGGSTDSMLVQHFLYDTASVRPLFQSAIDSTGILVNYFSSLYGRYPFWQEKYGHCFAPLGGGMEHQTMTTLGVYDMALVSHELGHQWWGDAVTYSTWKDIWLSEGWASYTELLYTEHYKGLAAAQAYRTNFYNNVLSQTGGSVIVDDTNNVYRIFDGRLTYHKGAAVAHMLRYVFNNDASYFAALRSYQQLYQFHTASTADFKAVMEAYYGHPLDTFFNQWVYGEGYPKFGANWNQVGNTVYVQLTQATSQPASVAMFHTPLEIKLQGQARDTTVKIYADTALRLYSFTFAEPMIDLIIDPTNQILNRNDVIMQDPSLAVKDVAASGGRLTVSPNPSKDFWLISGLTAGAALHLYDSNGTLQWQGTSLSGTFKVPCARLVPGIYQLKIRRADDGAAQMLKLQKI